MASVSRQRIKHFESEIYINDNVKDKFNWESIVFFLCFTPDEDAICQLAMQMSNFRVRGKLSMTYEPALARIFKDGRTETIRSCTPAAAAFIHEMSSENVDKGQFEI